MAQNAFGVAIIGRFEIALAEDDIRAAEIGIQPDGALEIWNGGRPVFLAGQYFAQTIPSHRIVWIDFDLLTHFGDAIVELGMKNIDLAEHEVGAGHFGVESEGFFHLGEGVVFVFALQHELGGEDVGSGGIGRHAE